MVGRDIDAGDVVIFFTHFTAQTPPSRACLAYDLSLLHFVKMLAPCLPQLPKPQKVLMSHQRAAPLAPDHKRLS